MSVNIEFILDSFRGTAEIERLNENTPRYYKVTPLDNTVNVINNVPVIFELHPEFNDAINPEFPDVKSYSAIHTNLYYTPGSERNQEFEMQVEMKIRELERKGSAF